MQVSEKTILELVALAAVAALVVTGKLDSSVLIAILGIIFGERVYTSVRKRA